jgi:hypothetical protein
MREMKFEVSVDEANLILEGLGQLPFVRVYGLISKLQAQARRKLDDGSNGSRSAEQEQGAEVLRTLE